MTKSFNEFRNQVLGKGYNIDGAYGNQCWDGYAKYCQYLGYPYANCTTSGYVKDIWNNRKTNGMLKNFVEVEIMQPGDIAVFKEVKGWTPLSHIAIFVKDLGNGYGLFLGQNQGGKLMAILMKLNSHIVLRLQQHLDLKCSQILPKQY